MTRFSPWLLSLLIFACGLEMTACSEERYGEIIDVSPGADFRQVAQAKAPNYEAILVT